jgi:hypothetical protein
LLKDPHLFGLAPRNTLARSLKSGLASQCSPSKPTKAFHSFSPTTMRVLRVSHHSPLFAFLPLGISRDAPWGRAPRRPNGCHPPPPDVRRVPLGADAKVCPPSIHLPGTLAPPYKSNPHPHLPVPSIHLPGTLASPYKSNPHPHLPVRRCLGDFAPVHRWRRGGEGERRMEGRVERCRGDRNLELPELRTRSSPSRFWSATAVALPPHQHTAVVPLKLRPLRSTSSLRKGRQQDEAVATPS